MARLVLIVIAIAVMAVVGVKLAASIEAAIAKRTAKIESVMWTQ